MNVAGVPWANVQALRELGVDAQLVVFNRGKLHPDADVDLQRPDGFLRGQLTQWRALGEISDDELRALQPRVRPGRTALRYFAQLEFDQ